MYVCVLLSARRRRCDASTYIQGEKSVGAKVTKHARATMHTRVIGSHFLRRRGKTKRRRRRRMSRVDWPTGPRETSRKGATRAPSGRRRDDRGGLGPRARTHPHYILVGSRSRPGLVRRGGLAERLPLFRLSMSECICRFYGGRVAIAAGM